MHAPDPSQPIGAAQRTEFPTAIAQAPTAGFSGCLLMNRVGRVRQELAAGRPVSDDDLRQYAADCTLLMEQAHARFDQHRIGLDREEAVLWMHQRDEAYRSLSPAWKASREAQIQQEIAQGVGFFVTEGESNHTALAARGAE